DRSERMDDPARALRRGRAARLRARAADRGDGMSSRRKVALAFVAVLAATAGVILWEDGRIDANARKAARAEATAVAAQRVNEAQNAIRRDLIRQARASDLRLCTELESIKERIRATVVVRDAAFLASLS